MGKGEAAAKARRRALAAGVTRAYLEYASDDIPYSMDAMVNFKKWATEQGLTIVGLDEVKGAELTALAFYAGSGYMVLNSDLRGVELAGSGDKEYSATELAEVRANAVKNLPVLDSLMRPIGRDIITHRAFRNMDKGDEARIQEMLNLPVGTEFIDKAFLSTSASALLAGQFAASAQPLMIKIRVPGTTRGLVRGGVEQEVILARGQRFRVISKGIDENGNRTMEIEVIP